jgi:chromodomain-helicase-DNA-binding protein 4
MYCHETAVRAEPLPPKNDEAEETASIHRNLPSDATSALGEDKQGPTTPPAIAVNSELGPVVSSHIPSSDVEKQEVLNTPEPPSGDASVLLFRCRTCRRPAHYAHLPQPESGLDMTPTGLAQYYQTINNWECTDCVSYHHTLDKVLAWRPYPSNAVESNQQPGHVPDYKSHLPREYLVKWIGRSYRRLQWVPHMWLVSTYPAKLKNFLASGPKVQLLDRVEDIEGGGVQDIVVVADTVKESDPSFLIDNSRDPSAQPASDETQGPPPPLPDAESRIPLAWRTIDRVLDIRLWDPARRKRTQKQKKIAARRRGGTGKWKRVESDDGDDIDLEDADSAQAKMELVAIIERGEEPSDERLETVDQWEHRTGDTFGSEQAELVVWAFIKWAELPYEECMFILSAGVDQ